MKNFFQEKILKPTNEMNKLAGLKPINMADTIIATCEQCENDFDYLPNAGLEKICDECAEEVEDEIDPMTLAKDRAVEDSI